MTNHQVASTTPNPNNYLATQQVEGQAQPLQQQLPNNPATTANSNIDLDALVSKATAERNRLQAGLQAASTKLATDEQIIQLIADIRNLEPTIISLRQELQTNQNQVATTRRQLGRLEGQAANLKQALNNLAKGQLPSPNNQLAIPIPEDVILPSSPMPDTANTVGNVSTNRYPNTAASVNQGQPEDVKVVNTDTDSNNDNQYSPTQTENQSKSQPEIEEATPKPALPENWGQSPLASDTTAQNQEQLSATQESTIAEPIVTEAITSNKNQNHKELASLASVPEPDVKEAKTTTATTEQKQENPPANNSANRPRPNASQTVTRTQRRIAPAPQTNMNLQPAQTNNVGEPVEGNSLASRPMPRQVVSGNPARSSRPPVATANNSNPTQPQNTQPRRTPRPAPVEPNETATNIIVPTTPSSNNNAGRRFAPNNLFSFRGRATANAAKSTTTFSVIKRTLGVILLISMVVFVILYYTVLSSPSSSNKSAKQQITPTQTVAAVPTTTAVAAASSVITGNNDAVITTTVRNNSEAAAVANTNNQAQQNGAIPAQNDGLTDLVVVDNEVAATVSGGDTATPTVVSDTTSLSLNVATNNTVATTTVPVPTPTPSNYPSPQRVSIARIGVDTKVAQATVVLVPGSKTQYERDIPDHAGGHHQETPDCGGAGVSIVAGHNYWGGKGVFYALHDAVPGDIILCTAASGTIYRYQVISLNTYQPNDTSWYHLPTGDTSTFGVQGHYLILYTCTADFKNRIAVLAKQLTTN